MAVLTTLRDLFSRGLESIASWLLGRGKNIGDITNELNARLQSTGDSTTRQTVGLLVQRVRAADTAAGIRQSVGAIGSDQIPRAPGMSFVNPRTGRPESSKTFVVITYRQAGKEWEFGVPVYHGPEWTWDQIRTEADKQAAEVMRERDTLPASISDDDVNALATGYRSFQAYRA